MLENTPLDAGINAPEDARPAGEWLEGYWRQTQPRAMAAAWLCWAYVIFQLYLVARNWELYAIADTDSSIITYYIGTLLQIIPVVLVGHFLLQFSHQLRLALNATDQTALESAFRQLWRAFLFLLIAVGYWMLGWVSQAILLLHYTLTGTL